MARYSKKDTDYQSEWEEKLNRAKKVRKDWKDKFKVDLALAYFDGQQNPGYPAEEWITLNKVYSHLKTTLPSLYRTDPYFYVKLKRSYSPNPLEIAMWEQKGKTRQAMLNYLKGELDLKKKVRLAIQDAHFAYGIIKTHYHADMVENPDYGQQMYGDDYEELIDEETGEPLMEPEMIPTNERYCWTRVHFDDFLWDEDAGPLEDTWSWVAQRVVKPLSEVKKDKRFNKKAIDSIADAGETKGDEEKNRETRKKGNDVAGRGDDAFNNYHRKGEKKKDIVYWEIYHINEKKWCCIAEGAQIPLMDKEDLPPGIDKHPYSVLIFTPRDDSPYPIPPLSQGLDAQKEYNLSRSRMLTHRKRFNRKYEVLMQALVDEAEASKLESGEDGTIIGVQQLGAIQPIKDAPLDQQNMIEMGYLNKDMTELFGGTADEARGIAGADSATQAGIMDKRLDVREGDSMSLVIDFVTDLAKKMDQLIQAHITRDEAVAVTGPEGEYWQMIREDDYEKINGEYEYSVNVGSTLPNLPQVERSSWMAFLGVIAQAPQLAMSKRLLKKTAEMHHLEDDSMIDEIYNIAKQMMQMQQQAAAAKAGDTAGVSRTNPAGATAGIANGNLSLNQPGAGNL